MTLTAYLIQIIKFLALSLVSLRISWLLIEDALIRDQRAWLIARAQKQQRLKLALFWQCPFCIGLWVVVALVAVVAQFTVIRWPVLWPFAINIVVAPVHHFISQNLK